MSNEVTAALNNWVPYRLYEEGNTPYCRWLYLGDDAMAEPFFDDTISKCRSLPVNSQLRRCCSNLDILPEWASLTNAAEPTAFIFHVSRCGSTLVSQLLGLQTSNIVLSEVPFFDQVLREGHNKNNMSTMLPVLQAAIQLYGAKRLPAQQQLFIKTDSWHIHFYKELRQLYPHTPFVLLYRQPDEVIRSQQKKRGMQAVPGVVEPSIFGFDTTKMLSMDLDEYMARVLEGYFEKFIELTTTDAKTLLLNYNEGGMALVEKIASFAGTSISDQEKEAMLQRSSFHGKFPDQVFAEATIKEELPAYLRKAMDLYQQLESIRQTSSAE
jgi:Sulfotransferase domain